MNNEEILELLETMEDYPYYYVKDILPDLTYNNEKQYYDNFFSCINLVDTLADQFFNNDGYVEFDITKFRARHYGVAIYNTLMNRLIQEHRLDEKILKEHSKLLVDGFHIGYGNVIKQNKEKRKELINTYYQNRQYIREEQDRMTGRSTRIANKIIQTIYANKKQPIMVFDHFIGGSVCSRRIGYNKRADRDVFERIRRRIEIEFPEEIKKHIMFRVLSCEIIFNYEPINNINYNNFDL